MPLIRVQLSISIPQETQTALMSELSAAVAQALGKPESYMMVVVQPQVAMLMGTSSDPTALVEVRSVGSISPEQARGLSKRIGEILERSVQIGTDRMYANFTGVPGTMWGYDGRTFG